MDISELLKKYSLIKRRYILGTLSPDVIPLYESLTAIVGSGELFPIVKAHYIDCITIDAIAEQLGYEPRTIYRRQKNELSELKTILYGNWIRR